LSAEKEGLRVAIASSAEVGIPILQALITSSHDLLYVITNPDKKSGRGQGVTPNPFAAYALQHNLEVFKPDSNDALQEIVSRNTVDLVVTVAYGRLIQAQSLKIPKYGWLNIHFSLLPKWRGAAPVQYAIMNQEKSTGISIFQLEEGMDTGPIYFSKEIEIGETQTTPELLDRLSKEASEEIPHLLSRIAAGAVPTSQPAEVATYAPKLDKAAGRIQFSKSVAHVLAHIRALSHNPGTFLTFRGQRLGIDKAVNCVGWVSLKPLGTLFVRDQDLFLQVSDGAVQLLYVTPSGKKSMSGADFARGARIIEGELCE